MRTTTAPGTAEALRAQMVAQIQSSGSAPSEAVAQAMRTVPRHTFLPDATVQDAYADRAVVTKRDRDGAVVSCASVPSLVATMLDQLAVRPGNRILEIGAGTGYNAALLAHITGPSGQVTTLDIDPDVATHAQQALQATGYSHVRVLTRDGARGAPEHAPYDRIIVTTGAWDLPVAWWEQLVAGGRLVVPLRWRGQTRSIAFIHEKGETDRLRSDSLELCGFVPMIGPNGERTGHIDPDVTLAWDTDQPIDPAAPTGVLDQPATTVWSGVTIGPTDSLDGIWLRLTVAEPGCCRIAAEPAAVASGRCTPAIPARSPALVEGASLAYLTKRRLDQPSTEPRWELGVIGHGPIASYLASRFCGQIGAWDRDRTTQPVVTAYPADTRGDELPDAHVIIKRTSWLTFAW